MPQPSSTPPRRRRKPSKRDARPARSLKATRLAQQRLRRGLTQQELATATGLSLSMVRRLERGETRNPPLRYLVNCAIALGVKLDQILEDEWLEWYPLDLTHAAKPPDHEQLWRPA